MSDGATVAIAFITAAQAVALAWFAQKVKKIEKQTNGMAKRLEGAAHKEGFDEGKAVGQTRKHHL